MKPAFWRLRLAVSSLRLIPHILIFFMNRNHSLIKADLQRWSGILRLQEASSSKDYVSLFMFLMTFTPEFRNLFYLRAGKWSRVFSVLCPRLGSLDIVAATIGPGLFIQHGESTYVSARKIGADCWIGRMVVVGYSAEGQYPTIGDNVRIFAGAKIIGNVTIGDGATIGLNTVIADNVPPGATMLGVPGRIVWRANPAPTNASTKLSGNPFDIAAVAKPLAGTV